MKTIDFINLLPVLLIVLSMIVFVIAQHYIDRYMVKKKLLLTIAPAVRRKQIQLIGKVSGLPRPWVCFKFGFWEAYLCMLGYEVFNPVKRILKDSAQHYAVEQCSRELNNNSKYAFMIPGWKSSPGSLALFCIAESCNLTIFNWYGTLRDKK